MTSDNCTICAEEFDLNDLQRIALSAVNITKYSICKNCLQEADPSDDYKEVKSIIHSFFNIDENLE